MGLLDKVKQVAGNQNGNNTLPLGDYTGTLSSIKRETRKDYEVCAFRYTVTTKDDTKAVLEDVMFLGGDKVEEQLAFRIAPMYNAGALTGEAVNRAMDNLPGFMDYVVKQMANYEVTVNLYEDEYNGRTNRRVRLQLVKPDDRPAF